MVHAAPASLQSLLDDIAQEQEYNKNEVKITPIATGGGNYTSELFRIKITAPGKEDLRLFAKVANINGKMRDEMRIAKFYATERFVYGTLVNVYKRLEENSSVVSEHRLYFPKYYGCNPKVCEETIVFEDLGIKGFGTHDRLKSIDWPYAVAAVTELAKFHALSFAHGQENPEEHAKVIVDWKYEFSADKQRMKGVWEEMIKGAVKVCKEEHRAKLGNYLSECASKVRNYYVPMKRPVLTHGDFRPSNLMHRVKDDGSLEIVTVDYQTVRAGCVATDLIYFVCAGTDAAFRAQHYSALVEEYYQQLQAALRRLNQDPDKVYPREDFDYELKECLPFGLMVSIFVLPLVTVEAANAPRLNDLGSESWHIKTSNLFADRMDGLVDTYVEWGVL